MNVIGRRSRTFHACLPLLLPSLLRPLGTLKNKKQNVFEHTSILSHRWSFEWNRGWMWEFTLAFSPHTPTSCSSVSRQPFCSCVLFSLCVSQLCLLCQTHGHWLTRPSAHLPRSHPLYGAPQRRFFFFFFIRLIPLPLQTHNYSLLK